MYDSFAQRRTSTEDAHARIVRGNPGFGGVVLHRDAVHIDATKRQRVLRLQGLGEACHAPTDSVALVEVRFDILVELPRKDRECAVARARPSVMIDHCIAQDTVEPCHGGFVALEPQLVQATRKGFLEDILRHIAVAHASFQEGEKRAAVLDEHRCQLVPRNRFALQLVRRFFHSVPSDGSGPILSAAPVAWPPPRATRVVQAA